MICKTCNKEHDGSYGTGLYCCRSCANTRVRTDETKKKISDSIKSGISDGRIKVGLSKGSTHKLPRSKVHAEKISQGIKTAWDLKGRVSEQHKKARNKANVYAYRARLRNAIPDDADLKLIQQIYMYCPDGHHVDHIIALAVGGQHHQDNLQYLPIGENCRKGKDRSYDESQIIDWRSLVNPSVAQLDNVLVYEAMG